MKKYSKVIIVTLLLLFCIGCDQVSKKIATMVLPRTYAINYFNGFFRLHYAENQGGFLSFGSVMPPKIRFWIFIVTVAIVLVCMLIYVLKSSHLPLLGLIAISFIIGGGLGNLIDRMKNNGKVIDFMSIGIGNIRSGIFNSADVIIMFGMILFLLSILRSNTSNS